MGRWRWVVPVRWILHSFGRRWIRIIFPTSRKLSFLFPPFLHLSLVLFLPLGRGDFVLFSFFDFLFDVRLLFFVGSVAPHLSQMPGNFCIFHLWMFALHSFASCLRIVQKSTHGSFRSRWILSVTFASRHLPRPCVGGFLVEISLLVLGSDFVPMSSIIRRQLFPEVKIEEEQSNS